MMNEPIGKICWAIAEGYIPAYSNGTEPQFTSHETVCILNPNDRDARIEMTIFIQIEIRSALTVCWFQRDAPVTFASTIYKIQNPFHWTLILRV